MEEEKKNKRKCSELAYGVNVIFYDGDKIRKGFVISINQQKKTISLLSNKTAFNIEFKDMLAAYNSMSKALWEINPNEAKFPGDELIPE